MGELDHRILMVTGAGSGIGRAVALLAAERGASVACVDRQSAEGTVAAIRDAGGSARPVEMDVRDEAAWAEAVSETSSEWGPVTLLCNVAGVTSDDTVDEATEQTVEGWHRILDINLMGTWLGMKAVLPGMIEAGGGRIVNTSSIAGLRGLVGVFAYSASKGGVDAITRQVASQFSHQNVLANSVAPGVIDTPLLAGNSEEMNRDFIPKLPTGRMGEPSEVAGLICYLFGPLGGYVSGQTISVDAGWGSRA